MSTKEALWVLVAVAFIIVLKFAAALFVWWLHLLLLWVALVVCLGAFVYLVYLKIIRR